MTAFELLNLTSAALLSAMLVIAIYNLRTARHLEQAAAPRQMPRVSLLIPARNEADHLRELLPRLSRISCDELEVLVLDDQSTDETAALVSEAAREVKGLRLLSGAELPAGWLGKNWACHQLAHAASGSVLIFCDADVIPAPSAISRTVSLMEEEGADVLTALPRHRFSGWEGRAMIPLVAQLPLLALLPLRQVTRSRRPSVSMANGQWLAFTRIGYESSGGHAAVRGEVVEDVALGRSAKMAGLRLLPVLATDSLEVEMYRSAREMREGFAKNLYALVGGHPLSFATALVIFLICAIYPWAAVLLGNFEALLPLALLIGLRVTGAVFFGHGWQSVVLHPAGAVLTLYIGFRSFVGYYQGSVRWKGRPVSIARTPAEDPVASQPSESSRLEVL